MTLGHEILGSLIEHDSKNGLDFAGIFQGSNVQKKVDPLFR